MVRIWNEVVDKGREFPDETRLGKLSGKKFFSSHTLTSVAVDTWDGSVVGLYVLHPNNIGRCSHICNASFAVTEELRGKHIGEKLVKDCLEKAPRYGFRVLMFNAVVKDNEHAIHLYERLGFVDMGTVPGGFRTNDGAYKDIDIFYHTL
ncbi:MAG: GNAT family N-acetyltransferase [Lachnospiraceae bacterium]|nr:GNAT family N-acetyltransferase [Lachnospiraceae bacterium]